MYFFPLILIFFICFQREIKDTMLESELFEWKNQKKGEKKVNGWLKPYKNKSFNNNCVSFRQKFWKEILEVFSTHKRFFFFLHWVSLRVSFFDIVENYICQKRQFSHKSSSPKDKREESISMTMLCRYAECQSTKWQTVQKSTVLKYCWVLGVSYF
jgi:hypothetical protein